MATIETNETVQYNFIVGLRNAHAVEKQALGIMGRQIDHLEQYQDVKQRLIQHSQETEQQIERLERILADFDTSHSAIKDAALWLSGNMAALAHVPASDEILKNSFANLAFENFEVAAYTSLITMAEEGRYSNALPLLQQTLDEERAMAQFVEQSIPMVTRKYLSLQAAGEQASH